MRRTGEASLTEGEQAWLASKYLSMVAEVAAKPENPGTAEAELIAADIVIQFLENHHLTNTLRSLAAEIRDGATRSFGKRWVARHLRVRGRNNVLAGTLRLRREGAFGVAEDDGEWSSSESTTEKTYEYVYEYEYESYEESYYEYVDE